MDRFVRSWLLAFATLSMLVTVTPVAGAAGAEPGQEVGAAAVSCVSGRWLYLHPELGLLGVPSYGVEIWDDDLLSPDDLLVEGYTDIDGRYTLCFDAVDEEGADAQEIYARFVSANERWELRTNIGNTPYLHTSGTPLRVAAGADLAVGDRQSGDSDGGMRAFRNIDRLWRWGRQATGAQCLDWGDTTCRPIVVYWSPISTAVAYYNPVTDTVHLGADDPNSDHTVIRTTALAVMDDVWNDALPTGCNVRLVKAVTTRECAWMNGFATWVAASVLNNPTTRQTDGTSVDLEVPAWGTAGWATGDAVEGRVAGSMIDVADAARATSDWWDTSTESQMTQWGTFQRWDVIGDGNRPANYHDFWTDRQLEGNDVSDERSRSSAFQNTIDYSFRNPLAPSVEETWPSPLSTTHGFRFGNSPTLNGGGWTAVAARGDGDVDLRLYHDLDHTNLLAASTARGAAIDVVAVDQRHRNARTGYPVVERVTGAGAYTIEWAEAKRAITDGVSTIALGSADVVRIRDTAHRTGLPVFYRVVPAASQNITVLLMDSSPTDSATWVRSRSQAVRTANIGASGVGESFSYTTDTDTLGLVVLNTSGGGTVRVYRDTTPPTGSVVINAGAPDTSHRRMTVKLSAKDAQTGIWQMRLSVDGTFDTEPWTAYKTTAQVTFAKGDGPKKLRAQFRNQAGMTVTTSDTIRLYTGPRCEGLIPTIRGTSGPDKIIGTAGDDIIVGLRRDDVIDGRGGNDIICGGAGRDTLIGGTGNDRLYGGPGDDSLAGGSGNDLLFGEGGGDELAGGAGRDVCHGGTGFDTILFGCEEKREIP